MTLPGPRQTGPRQRPPSPRLGVRRRYGTPAPPSGNPVTDSGATAWFDSRDGSGLQEIPSRIGAGVATLGSTTGIDTNDPTWSAGPPYGWTFDITDDYIDTSGTGMLPTFDFDAGSYTVLQVVTMPGVSLKQLWSVGSTSTRYFRMASSGTTFLNLLARGATTTAAGSSITVGGAGTRAVVGFTLNAGIANSYAYVGSTGTLGANFDITGVGTFVANQTAPRYGTFSYLVSGSSGAVLSAAVEYNGLALVKADMDTVAAYLLALY